MGFFSWLFGAKPEPVVVVKPKETKFEPQLTEAELAIKGFQNKLDAGQGSLDKARDTLYDQKAQLSAKKIALRSLGEEIENHKHALLVEEERALDAPLEERDAIEIAGQKLQNTILRKEEMYRSQEQTLETLSGTIDVLERNVTANEIGLSRRQSELESVKTAAAVLELNKTIQDNLPMRSFNVDADQLEVFMERQKLELEDINAESSSISFTHASEFSLPFKDRIKKEKQINPSEVNDQA